MSRLKDGMMRYNDRYKRFLKNLLRSVDYIYPISAKSIEDLVYVLKQEFYEKNKYIFKDGDTFDHIKFVVDGEVEIFVKFDQGEEIVLDTLF